MNATVRAIAQRLNAALDDHLANHILPFWSGPALDHEQGGWMAWLSNDLQPDRSQPKGLIVNSRILWAFSAAHQAKPDPRYRAMAERAFDYVMTRFWDAGHGGAFWQLDDAGRVRDDAKKIYGQAFCIYALTEYHAAFRCTTARDRAWQLFELVERHAHDAIHGGYAEVCARDWSPAGPGARLSAKDLAEKKSMNNHLHVLEAYTNLQRVTPTPLVAERLRELIRLFLTRILDARTGHLQHFFDERWQLRSDSYTFGHDIEATWLLCEAAEVLGDPALQREVEATAQCMAALGLEQGLSPEGGLYYEGRSGEVIDPGWECWPQAEALVGFINAFELTAEERYLRAAERVWDFASNHLVDRVNGEWFWRINPDGKPDATLPKVSEWKGPYHVTRACLEGMRRLRAFTHAPALGGVSPPAARAE